MAEIHAKIKIEGLVTMYLPESEVRALACLANYGDDAFLNVFYPQEDDEKRQLLRRHEKGLRSFLASIRKSLPGWLKVLDGMQSEFSVQEKRLT